MKDLIELATSKLRFREDSLITYLSRGAAYKVGTYESADDNLLQLGTLELFFSLLGDSESAYLSECPPDKGSTALIATASSDWASKCWYVLHSFRSSVGW